MVSKEVAVVAAVMTVQKALPLFRDGGSIILTASVGGSEGFEGFSVRPRLLYDHLHVLGLLI
ncbi:MAG: hypothetical protein WAM42_04310 [Candidatus Nitrosopolaris sp.]